MKIVCGLIISVWAVMCGQRTSFAETSVALEIVLAVDASSSIEDREYKLQVAGYANAFRDPDVISAIEALGPFGIAVTYVEWSSRFRQVQSVGWTHVHDSESSRLFANAIALNARQLVASGTALGEAVIYSVGLFKMNGFKSGRQIVDVSADDRYNAGSSPSYAKGIAQSMNVTVNGLAIDESGSLARYFRDNVITGPDAFVIAAQSFEDFAVSIKRKLLRELGQKNIANR